MTCSLKVPEPAKPEGLESSISDDCSSLFIAAKHNHKEMVEYLLGDDHHYDSSGVTALMVALKEGNIETEEQIRLWSSLPHQSVF